MFKDRVEAGQRLAWALSDYKGKDAVVLAIPRGGVVVGHQVAEELGAPLDIIVPRKIGAPGNPELAIGAVTQDGSLMLDPRLVEILGVPEGHIEEEARRQMDEIARRMSKYRGERPRPDLEGKIVILVDDGIATGATIRAAITSIRKQRPALLVVAVPVGPPREMENLKGEVDRVVCLMTPEPFYAIGQFYGDFSQTSDEEVNELLRRVEMRKRGP